MRIILKKIIVPILIFISKLVLWKYKPKIVAITGSVGKTSTKDAVFAVLSQFTHVRKSDKSYNSEIGMPLTILGLKNGWGSPWIWTKNIFKGLWLFLAPHKYPKWLVLEVGVGKPGDMKKTASWISTDAVIITGVGDTPSHIEFFEDRDHIIREKAGLIKTLKKSGILVLNGDNDASLSMKEDAKRTVFTYGFNENQDVKASDDNISYIKDSDLPQGVTFKVDVEGNNLPVVIEGVFGRNHIYAVLAALTLCHGFKFDILKAIDAVKSYDVPPGRMRLLRGVKDTLIVDDTYNSSPLALGACLRTVKDIKTKGRKIALLGDMLELGKHTEDAHQEMGALASEIVDVLVVVGPRAQGFKEGALKKGMSPESIFEFSNSYEARDFIKDFIEEGDLVLAKGSQGVRMERVVEGILLEKEKASQLLARQDPEWKKRK